MLRGVQLRMELSPRLYHWLVRPQWYVAKYNRQVVQKLLADFNFNSKTVVDFGCGIGTNCSLFSPGRYIGLDCNRQRIDYARCLYPDYRFEPINGPRLPLDDSSIDYVFIMAVLHHIASCELVEILRDFQRVLRTGGRILLIEPCLRDRRSVRNWMTQVCDRGRFIRNESAYCQLFRDNGFRVEHTQQFNKGFYRELFLIVAPAGR